MSSWFADNIKNILEAALKVRDELTFWSFCVFLAIVALYILISKTEWLQMILSATSDKLTKNQFYRIIRLALFSISVFLILFICFLFASPILLRFVNTQISNEEQIRSLSDSLMVNKNVNIALELFRIKEYDKASELLLETLRNSTIRPTDNLHGLVIATYYGAGRYEEAAREILEREKRSGLKDNRFWADFGLCIRKYAIKNSVLSAGDLINKFRKEYNSELLSYIWTVLPVDFLLCTKDGVHNVNYMPNARGIGKDERFSPNAASEVLAFIKLYPKDRFIGLAYYFLSDYRKALDAFDRNSFSYAKETCVYGWGYDMFVDIYTELKKQEYIHGGVGVNKMATAQIEPVMRQKIVKVIYYFKDFVEKYPNYRHADDAAVWIAWLEGKIGRISNAFYYLELSESIGNRDFLGLSEIYMRALYAQQNPKEQELLFNSKKRLQKDPYFGYLLSRTYFRVHGFRKAKLLADNAIELIDQFRGRQEYINNDPNYQGLLYISKMSNKLIDMQVNVGIASDLKYKEEANVFKNKYCDYRSALYLCDLMFKNKPNSRLLPNIIYTKIKSLMRWSWRDKYSPMEVFDLAIYMYDNYPNHKLTDDALAEALYALVFWEGSDDMRDHDVRMVLNIMKDMYYYSNSMDNALNIFSNYLYNSKRYAEAIENDSYLINNYRNTRFAFYAAKRIRDNQRHLNN